MATDQDQAQRVFIPKRKASATRALKNLIHLQKVAPDIIPEIEAQDLANAHRGIGEDLSGKLKGVLNRAPFPQPLNKVTGPLFQNALYFVQIRFKPPEESRSPHWRHVDKNLTVRGPADIRFSCRCHHHASKRSISD